ncbi:hypothetical protein [Paenibacillus sp. Soil522]|uniref:hypothetical protein n=1 Tax=Paenibacillus sp. Soil522 TaxID=1736388 RepID=UPI0006F785E1|nr:hypothetical protein [Paenibacillus sp. Soil522]KRE45830.1 hypothetical protein ASG81_12440 [Paenibacillus sp. Soil522]
MAYTIKQWRERFNSRSDLSRMCTHLTKPNHSEDLTNQTFSQINIKAVDTLLKILQDKKLNGSTTSTGYITGSTPAVCFQDAPLTGLIQNIRHEEERRKNNPTEKLRYCGVGLAFMKQFIYKKNGRPVIYDDSTTARKYLSPNEHWRIVDFSLSNDNNLTDWTHEREWRLPNHLSFEYSHVHVILYNPDCYKYFIDNCPKNVLEEIRGITTLAVVAI